MIGRGRMYSDQIPSTGVVRRLRGSTTVDEELPLYDGEGDPMHASPMASHRLHADACYQGRRSPFRRRAACRSRSPSTGRSSHDQMRVDSSLSPETMEINHRNSRRSIERMSLHPGSAARCAPPCPPHQGIRGRNSDRRFERRHQWHEDLGEGRGDVRGGRGSPPFTSRYKRNRGGGMGFRGRGRTAWTSFGGRGRRRSFSRSPSVDSVEEHRRSRSREKARRRRQYETIQRYCRPGGEQQVCWDGFQWVRKGDTRGDIMFDQTMNATRKARRLHIGNLPLLLDATEEDLSAFLWDIMRRVNPKYNNNKENPVLHVWFSKERGGNYGFVEMSSVEAAEIALSLNPLVWKGQQLRVNRPTEWRSADINFAEIAGAANVPLLESVAAATAIAETTGDSASLAKLLGSLSEEKRKILAEFLLKCPKGLAKGGTLPVELLQCQIQAELLHGQPSRVVRIANPVPEALSEVEMEETLADVLEEVNKKRDVLKALIITQDLEKLLPAAEVGDIYVQFATGIQADICILTFAGRMYDGRPLTIERFNELVWRQSMQKFAKSLLHEILAQFM